MSNFSENEMIPVAVKIIKNSPNGIETKDLIKRLREELKPDGEDTIILSNRSDDKFSQKARNLKSHKTLEKKSYVVFKENKFFITLEGEKYLNKLKFFIDELVKSSNKKKLSKSKTINFDQKLRDIFNTLTPKEEKVVKCRLGLFGEKKLTLEKIGSNFSVTRERIRQVEAKAIRKLKHPARIKLLRLPLYRLENLITETFFSNEEEFKKKLEKNNFITNLNLSQLKEILILFEILAAKKFMRFRGKYYVIESQFYFESLVSSIDKKIKHKAKNYGIVNINLILQDLKREKFSLDKKSLIDLISQKIRGDMYLNSFLMVNTQKSNKLINAIKETMSITNKIKLEDLKDCIKRNRRLDSFSPPVEVLKKITQKIGYETKNDYVENKNFSKEVVRITGVKKKLFEMFSNYNGMMSYEAITKECDNYNINLNSANVLIYENLFTQPKKGIFCLAGTEIDQNTLISLEKSRKKLLKELMKNINFSHDKMDGKIIIDFPKAIRSPYIWVSYDFRDLIPDGNYNLSTQNKIFKIKIFHNKIWISDILNFDKSQKDFISLKLDIVNKKIFYLNGSIN